MVWTGLALLGTAAAPYAQQQQNNANPSAPGLSTARYQALVDNARTNLEALMNRVEKTECCNSKNAFFNEANNQCVDALTMVVSSACSN
jgi:hypothetical protein